MLGRWGGWKTRIVKSAIPGTGSSLSIIVYGLLLQKRQKGIITHSGEI
jgi:hypothetical protein